jgi:drug/metabolite transporter (DMT)-like permease
MEGVMDGVVYVAVLAAALMHASWNAVIKVNLDRFSAILLLSLVQSGIAGALILALPAPHISSWPWIAASALLHAGYKLFLARAYEHGDLSQVYPLARGTAPLLVALAGVFLLAETLTASRLAAILAISSGVLLMAVEGLRKRSARKPTALLYAFGTAVFTAGYTIVDGIGARIGGTASGYTMWMFLGDGIVMSFYALVTKGRAAFIGLAGAWQNGLIAGSLSLGSYWIAIWAFTLAPIALVAALRETSVLFAMLIGVFFLGEQAGRSRWLAAAIIGIGLILVRG